MLGANWAPAALLLLLAASAAAAAADEPLEDEVESAPFAIVVEHEDGWRCGGALVSLRAALSTATCARGRGAPPAGAGADLWARAPGAITAEGARRVARIALASDSQGLSENEKWTEKAWIGVVLDMALLELEAPFGAAASARPILMAAGDECEPRGSGSAPACHVVRTPARAGGALRVGNAERTSPMACATIAPHWAAISDTALCLVGPEFCQSDWGVGVVCAGKLCGVLSRSARSPGESGENSSEGGGGAGCGDTHAALHVPRWQQFVHCAQTRRRCGRDSCASVCSERMLLEASVKEEGGLARRDGKHHPRHRPTSPTTTAPEDDYMKMRITTYSTQWPRSEAQSEWLRASSEAQSDWRRGSSEAQSEWRRASSEAHSEWFTVEHAWRRAGAGGGAGSGADVDAGTVPTRTSLAPSTPPPTPNTYFNASVMGGRMVQFEFEPYRADFKIGEYGDNEASYDAVGGGGGGGGEEPARTTSSTEPPATSRVPGPEALQEDTNSTAQLMELTAGGARQLSTTTSILFTLCFTNFGVSTLIFKSLLVQ